ncbi:MAG: PTS sugar transporter subunit IIC [Christensenellaceae bacterium]|nr:PTS sugar transporter subunit IIC [Christensenellaceae bacterium]
MTYYCASSFWLHGWQTVTRPFIGAAIVGIILGDLETAAIVGANIQLVYMGWMLVGGGVTTDAAFAGVVATALAIAGNLDTAAALALAVPLGVIGSWVWPLRNTINTFIMHMADKACAKGDVKKLPLYNVWLPQIPLLLITAVPTTLAVFFGADAIASVYSGLGESVIAVVNTLGGVLPALGIAITLKFIMKKSLIPYFFLGFLMVATLGMSILTVTLFSIIIAALYVLPKLKGGNAELE